MYWARTLSCGCAVVCPPLVVDIGSPYWRGSLTQAPGAEQAGLGFVSDVAADPPARLATADPGYDAIAPARDRARRPRGAGAARKDEIQTPRPAFGGPETPAARPRL